jgi:hypothetical protein
MERFCYKEYSCELSKPKYLPYESFYHGQSFWKVGENQDDDHQQSPAQSYRSLLSPIPLQLAHFKIIDVN